MRTIKFRGNVVLGHASNQWKEGDLIQYHMQEDQQIYNANIRSSYGIVYAINPKTLGQFTGLYDKNGKEVFEGDVVKLPAGNMRVSFSDGAFVLIPPKTNVIYEALGLIEDEYEIIGNIHDNPELLEQ